jgi:hypothetical protein
VTDIDAEFMYRQIADMLMSYEYKPTWKELEDDGIVEKLTQLYAYEFEKTLENFTLVSDIKLGDKIIN